MNPLYGRVDAGSGQIQSNRPRHRSRQPGVTGHSEGQVAGIGAAGRSLEARDVTALLIDRDHEAGTLCMQGCAKVFDLLGRDDIAREQAEASDARGSAASHPIGRFGSGEARKEASIRQQLDRLHVQPFTAPAVNPPATCRCTSRKKTTTGRAVSVAPAIKPPQSVPC